MLAIIVEFARNEAAILKFQELTLITCFLLPAPSVGQILSCTGDSVLLPKGLRVLVVYSDRDSRKLLVTLVNIYEIEAITAACISESLELVQ